MAARRPKIEYVKSTIERAGWNLPGPLNIDQEEEENVDQDDLANPVGAERGSEGHALDPESPQLQQN